MYSDVKWKTQVMSPEHVVLGCDVCVLKNPLCPAHPGPPCGPESQLILSSSCLDLHHPYQPSFHGLFLRAP